MTFANLNLPPGGRGFVSLFLQPLSGLPLPTIVLNRAHIAYGNAAPMASNAVFHTIGLKYVKTDVLDWAHQGLSFRMQPNPAMEEVVVTLDGTAAPQIRHWRLFDAKGVLVNSGMAEASSLTLDVRALPKGLYFLQLQTTGGLTKSGKLCVY